MQVQIFPNIQEFGENLIPREGSLGVFDLPEYFDPALYTVEYADGSIIVYEKEPEPEPSREKHARIYNLIVTAPDLEGIDLEGETFTDFEIGEMITARVFGGNPHAEKALTNKVLAVSLALIQGQAMTQEMQDKLTEAELKKAHVDQVRNLFNLGNL